MKQQKDISTLIQEGEKKLTVQPSAGAWGKLEKRLDAHEAPREGRLVRFRWMSIAAAVLVLVAAGIFWNRSQMGDMAFDGFAPEFLETLTGDEDCSPYCALLEKRKQLPEDYAWPARWEN